MNHMNKEGTEKEIEMKIEIRIIETEKNITRSRVCEMKPDKSGVPVKL